jgi:hypothetical protein
MDTFASIITFAVGFCIVIFSVAAIAGSLYGILVWYPAYRRKKVDALKATGRQGKATLIRVPESHQSFRRAVYTMVTIGLEIDVPGVDIYQVDKTFTFPTGSLDLLEEGKEVAVWIDPNNPRDLDKIVINVK